MKKVIMIFMAVIAVTAARAQEAAESGDRSIALTLEDCIDYAIGNNYSRRTMELSEESYDVIYNQSKLERLPSVSASLSEGYSHFKDAGSSWTGNYSFDAGMTIFNGGNINQTIQSNRLRMEQSGYQTTQYDNELTIQILQSFLTILGNEELLKLQESILVSSEEQAKQGKDRFMSGQILESDYLLLESQFVSDRNNLLETRTNRDNSLLTLKGLLSMDMYADLRIIYPDTATIKNMIVIPSEDCVVSRSMETLPDLDILDYAVEIARTNLKISKASYYPTLKLSGGIGTGHRDDFSNYGNQLADNFNQSAGLTLSIPIFNYGRTRSQVKQSKITLEKAELDRMQSELNILQTVIQEYRGVGTALSYYQTFKIKEEAYRKAFEAYSAQFNVGVITAVDLLQQQNDYITAVNQYVQSKYSFILKRKILDVYMGEKIKM